MTDLRYICNYYNIYLSIFWTPDTDVRSLFQKKCKEIFNSYSYLRCNDVSYTFYDKMMNNLFKKYYPDNMIDLVNLINSENSVTIIK